MDNGDGGQSSAPEPPWGKLVPVDPAWSILELQGDAMYVGRSQAGNDARVDIQHLQITRCDDVVYLENLSPSSTFVDGCSVPQGVKVVLQPKTEVSLVSDEEGMPTWLYHPLKRARPGTSSSRQEVEESSVASQGLNRGGVFAGLQAATPTKRAKVSADEDALKVTCGVCHGIWQDCVACVDCMHNFCEACLKDWLNRQSTCPECRGPVTKFNANHFARGAVEDYYKAHPEVKRTPKKAEATLGAQPSVQGPLPPSGDTGSSQNPDEDDAADGPANEGNSEHEDLFSDEEAGIYQSDEDEAVGCLQCPGSGQTVGDFTCSAEAPAHAACSKCYGLLPLRPTCGVAQRCAMCNHYCCDLYWRSQTGGETGCPSPRGAMKKILLRYLDSKGLRLQDALEESLRKLADGQWALEGLHVYGKWILPAGLGGDSILCMNCAEQFFADLMYKFRSEVPSLDLPPEAAQRADCWYGHGCWTQYKPDQQHAKRRNHVCEPTRTAGPH